MSRRTKKDKSGQYAILANGQVVRMDTPISGEQAADARGFTPGKIVHAELDLDYSREHRDSVRLAERRRQEQVTDNFKKLFGEDPR